MRGIISARELEAMNFHEWVAGGGYLVVCSKCDLQVMVVNKNVLDGRCKVKTVKRSITDPLDSKYFNCGSEYD